jgi:hypothetical protein
MFKSNKILKNIPISEEEFNEKIEEKVLEYIEPFKNRIISRMNNDLCLYGAIHFPPVDKSFVSNNLIFIKNKLNNFFLQYNLQITEFSFNSWGHLEYIMRFVEKK